MAVFFVADIEGNTKFGNSRPELFLGKGVLKIYRRTPMPKCDFKQLY